MTFPANLQVVACRHDDSRRPHLLVQEVGIGSPALPLFAEPVGATEGTVSSIRKHRRRVRYLGVKIHSFDAAVRNLFQRLDLHTPRYSVFNSKHPGT